MRNPGRDFFDKLDGWLDRLLSLLPNIGGRTGVGVVFWFLKLASVHLDPQTAGRRGRDNLGKLADR